MKKHYLDENEIDLIKLIQSEFDSKDESTFKYLLDFDGLEEITDENEIKYIINNYLLRNIFFDPRVRDLLDEKSIAIERCKILEMEKDLGHSLVAEKTEIKSKIESLELELESANELVKNRKTIEEKIKDFFKASRLSSRESSLSGEIKKDRLKRIFDLLSKAKDSVNESIQLNFLNESKREGIKSTYIIFLIFFVIIGSIFANFVMGDIIFLILGIFLGVVLFLIFLYQNFFAKDDSKNETEEENFKKEKLLSFDDILAGYDKRENAMLINTAWLEALRIELENLDKDINQRLNGKKYNLVLDEISSLRERNNEIYNLLDETHWENESDFEYDKLKKEIEILDIEYLEKSKNLELKNDYPIILVNFDKINSKIIGNLKIYIESLNKRIIYLVQKDEEV